MRKSKSSWFVANGKSAVRTSVQTRWTTPLLIVLCFGLLIATAAPEAAAQLADVPAAYELIAENSTFQLYVDSATLAFKLLDKRSGYLWHSGIDELAEGDRLNRSWQAFALSGISIEYLDQRAANRRVSITNSEHTLEVTRIENGIAAQIIFLEYSITVGMRLQLEADGVRVEVPFEGIHEGNPAFKLGRVYVYPFFGATRGSSVTGYMFVPDGSGSLIRFADTTKARNMFYGRYYGADLGIIAIMPHDTLITNPLPISYPVFGMVHGEGDEAGQNGFLSVVEQGAAYGEVQVHPAGIITNFNFLYNAFIYNEPYFQATNRSGAGVTTTQRQPNRFDAVVHYRFLTGEAASYVGMAQSYQRYLIDKGMLHRQDFTNPNIGIRLEFLGGDKEPILFWSRFIPMTTIPQLRDILDKLALPNTNVIYYGWQPLGANTMPPTSLTLERSIGDLADLKTLAAEIKVGGGDFALYLDPQMALKGEAGYSARTDIAIAITNIAIEGFNRNYGYYFTFDALEQRYTALVNDIAAQLGADNAGLALDSIGWTLYSDFHQSAPLNRVDAIIAYQQLLKDAPLRLGMYRPNDYLFSVTQAYYDLPLGDNGYVYTSKPVPFLPIVLAGYIPYYGTALNFSSNRRADLLRHVEYGVYPSYFVTHEPTADIINTGSYWIYTSSYDQWGDEIRQTYTWLNSLLSPVRGQPIVAHQPLTDGVLMTTYANGRQIIVNTTDQPYTHNGRTIEAMNAALMETP
jgi:hypothetical protein